MPMAAEKEGRKIAVEVKTFAGLVDMDDLYNAIGQYLMYKRLIRKREPERVTYLAVPDDAYDDTFYPAHAQEMRADFGIHLIVFNSESEEIIRWIE